MGFSDALHALIFQRDEGQGDGEDMPDMQGMPAMNGSAADG
jgi:hypothetical protein